MSTLADEQLVLFAGPLAGTDSARLRALLIVNANDAMHVAPARPSARSFALALSVRKGNT